MYIPWNSQLILFAYVACCVAIHAYDQALLMFRVFYTLKMDVVIIAYNRNMSTSPATTSACGIT